MNNTKQQTGSEPAIDGNTVLGNRFIYECSITYAFSDEDYTKKSEIIAETPSKARYKFYNELEAEEPYSEYFKYIKVKKIGALRDDYLPKISEQDLQCFERVTESRGISFARIGMKISVAGQIGKIVGANSSMNLDVDFIGDGTKSNCHPTWETIYFDDNNAVLKSFCKSVA
jgi:hypothetical protein